MISNEGYGKDGKSSQHKTRSKGSVYTVQVGSRSLQLYPLVIVCLGLLDTILLLTAVVIGIYCSKLPANDEPSPQQIKVQGLLLEVAQLQIIHSEAVKAQEESKLALEKELGSAKQLKQELQQGQIHCEDLQRRLETLEVEKATMTSTSTDTQESCGQCLPGWVLLNTTCYFYSHSASGPLKNWTDSRNDCLSHGADLVVIDNWEEQVNLFDHLPKLPSRHLNRFVGVWIGLTDKVIEGTWVWVNDWALLDDRYWINGEPNDHNEEGADRNESVDQDCAGLLMLDDPLKSWFDADCQQTKDWICEMPPHKL